MKLVRIIEVPAQLLGERPADSGFARSGNTEYHGNHLPNVIRWQVDRLPNHRLICTLDQRVRWQAFIKRFAGTLYACNRQFARIQETELDEHRGLVPVDVFMCQLALAEA